MQMVFHYGGHFLLPFFLARLFFRKRWLSVAIIFLAANIIDIDHLLAIPKFNPCRCSLGFHPLHGLVAIVFYVLLIVFPIFWLRILGMGVLLHLGIDGVDCLWMRESCSVINSWM